MSEFAEYIKMIFTHQYLVEQAEKKTAELDAQDRFDQDKFIVSLGDIMKQVRLTGITRKGKTRIGNSGDVWNVVEGAVQALSPSPNGSLFLRSLDGRDARWVEITDDPNFTVEFL